ncbi:hypothetical protein IWQ60_005903 [Tieghemiomyces parasiticus]|uniref:Pentacotripeptide-repeat region of PRORP domain-containing protein n=1 Tax=Tieghemiomyces parasiticus TaxID=78921 RepID=A0A9W8DSN0_9FUNG|nr:hypothetical protein IWQ60_005903 [Tieghemiomyces parasiticus]
MLRSLVCRGAQTRRLTKPPKKRDNPVTAAALTKKFQDYQASVGLLPDHSPDASARVPRGTREPFSWAVASTAADPALHVLKLNVGQAADYEECVRTVARFERLVRTTNRVEILWPLYQCLIYRWQTRALSPATWRTWFRYVRAADPELTGPTKTRAIRRYEDSNQKVSEAKAQRVMLLAERWLDTCRGTRREVAALIAADPELEDISTRKADTLIERTDSGLVHDDDQEERALMATMADEIKAAVAVRDDQRPFNWTLQAEDYVALAEAYLDINRTKQAWLPLRIALARGLRIPETTWQRLFRAYRGDTDCFAALRAWNLRCQALGSTLEDSQTVAALIETLALSNTRPFVVQAAYMTHIPALSQRTASRSQIYLANYDGMVDVAVEKLTEWELHHGEATFSALTYACVTRGLTALGRYEETKKWLDRIATVAAAEFTAAVDATTPAEDLSLAYTNWSETVALLGEGGWAVEAERCVNLRYPDSATRPLAVTEALVVALQRHGHPDRAVALYRSLPGGPGDYRPDAASTTTVAAVVALAELDQFPVATALYDDFHAQQPRPTTDDYNRLILTLPRLHDAPQPAFALYREMCHQYVRPNLTTFCNLYRVCLSYPNHPAVMLVSAKLPADMAEARLRYSAELSNLWIELLTKTGHLDRALEVLELMLVDPDTRPDHHTYEVLIRALCRQGQILDAVNFLPFMRRHLVRPSKNLVDYVVDQAKAKVPADRLPALQRTLADSVG